jgi:hypothetical protein
MRIRVANPQTSAPETGATNILWELSIHGVTFGHFGGSRRARERLACGILPGALSMRRCLVNCYAAFLSDSRIKPNALGVWALRGSHLTREWTAARR